MTTRSQVRRNVCSLILFHGSMDNKSKRVFLLKFSGLRPCLRAHARSPLGYIIHSTALSGTGTSGEGPRPGDDKRVFNYANVSGFPIDQGPRGILCVPRSTIQRRERSAIETCKNTIPNTS